MGAAQQTTQEAIGRDEQRRRQLIGLPGGDEDVARLLDYMGDPSWRVRKATLTVVPRFLGSAELVGRLVDGLASADNAGLRNICSEALLLVGGAAVPQLLLALRTPNRNQRKFVAEILGGINTDEASAGLLAALDDEEANVRDAVSESLGRIGGEAVVAALQVWLAATPADEPQRAAYALDALARTVASLPFSELERWLSKRALRRQVYSLLGDCGDRRAIALLRQGLQAGAIATRAVAAVALDKCLHDDKLQLDAGARQAALMGVDRERLLGLVAAPEDRPAAAALRLLGTLREPELAYRMLAASSCRSFLQLGIDLVRDMGPGCIPVLQRHLNESDDDTLVAVLELFGLFGDHRVLDDCLHVAATGGSRPAEAAIRVLGQLTEPRSVAALVELVKRGKHEVFDQAGLALVLLGQAYPEEVGLQVRRAIAAQGPSVPLLFVLGRLGRRGDLDLLRAAMAHRHSDIRCAALAAAADLGGVTDDEFVFALADESPEVRVTAARALGAFRSEAVAAALLGAANDGDPWVAATCLTSLTLVDPERATLRLMRAAKRVELPIAVAALQGLAELDSGCLAAALADAIDHPRTEVVREALQLTDRLPSDHAARLVGQLLSDRPREIRWAAAQTAKRRCLALIPSSLETAAYQESDPHLREILRRMLEDVDG